MSNSPRHSHRSLARLMFPMLLAVAVLPEIIIVAVAVLARLTGCRLDQQGVCEIGPLVVPRTIDNVLEAAGVSIQVSANWRQGFYLTLGVLLVACFVVVMSGWSRVTSRLLLGSAAALFLGLLPLFAPGLAIELLANKNVCDTAGGDECLIFGGIVERAFDAVSMPHPLFLNKVVLLAVGLFALYAVVVIVLGIVSAAGSRKSRQLHS
jgi:hypothetical protein